MAFLTQMNAARQNQTTDAMMRVADDEYVTVQAVREQVALGRMVIPTNREHRNLKPIGIGRMLRTKINANIGNSPLSEGVDDELDKLACALRHGADTVMDLSTGPQVNEIRARILECCDAPLGTVPIYQALVMVEDPMELTIDLLIEVIEEQARQGVDYMTLHAGLLRDQLPAARQRVTGIVSRGGAILAKWMSVHRRENPLFTHFDRILDICLAYDVTLSLGDGMRPGCLADASDRPQFAELKVLGDLVRRCRAAGVQAMVEGPGHIPLNEIEMNMKKEEELCDGAPFYILGPVVVDCAPGYDHITSAIGGALGAYFGASMLCYVTPREHLGLPTLEDVRAGVIAHKIAAHAADIGLHRPNARDRDDAISRARASFDWAAQFECALDPEKARTMRQEAMQPAAAHREKVDAGSTCEKQGDQHPDQSYCSMCGPKFCSMKISKDI